jgi:hypothetical protein
MPSDAVGIRILQAPNLARISWLVHGFSTRGGGFSPNYGGGALNLGNTAEDSAANVGRNRAAFLQELGAPDRPLASLRQVHSDLIWRAEGTHPGAGDGLVTASADQILAIRTADCLPILLADTRRHTIAALHAGWRGTLHRIAEKGVGEMHRWFGSRPEDLWAAIGPGIGGCCYEVGEEVREHFQTQFAYADALFTESKESNPIHERYPLLFLTARAPGHSEALLPKQIRLDLPEANRRQLLVSGLPAGQIWVSRQCTSCHPELFFSYRRDGGHTGRMMAVIGMRQTPSRSTRK